MDTQTLPVGYRQSKHSDDTFNVHAELPVRQDVPERMTLAQELGLGDTYVDKFAPGTDTDTKRWQHCRLSIDEWLVVQCYFPKCYGFEGDSLETFAFQELPEPVLRIWKEAKESGFFPNFQLRTTEGQGPDSIPSLTAQLDPILIGFHSEPYNGRQVCWPYRLAQFGMDDPIRASIQNMARTVRHICLKGVRPRKLGDLYWADAEAELFVSFIGGAMIAFSTFVVALILYNCGFHPSVAWALLGPPIPGIFFIGRRLFLLWRLKHYGIKVLRPRLRKRLEAIQEAAAAKRILAAG